MKKILFLLPFLCLLFHNGSQAQTTDSIGYLDYISDVTGPKGVLSISRTSEASSPVDAFDITVYAPDGKTIDAISFGCWTIGADGYWIEDILYGEKEYVAPTAILEPTSLFYRNYSPENSGPIADKVWIEIGVSYNDGTFEWTGTMLPAIDPNGDRHYSYENGVRLD